MKEKTLNINNVTYEDISEVHIKVPNEKPLSDETLIERNKIIMELLKILGDDEQTWTEVRTITIPKIMELIDLEVLSARKQDSQPILSDGELKRKVYGTVTKERILEIQRLGYGCGEMADEKDDENARVDIKASIMNIIDDVVKIVKEVKL